MNGFEWTEGREIAASLLAEDRLSDEAIAARVGITRRQLANWKLEPEFDARVKSLVEDFRKAARSRGIAIVENRVAALQERWEKMHRVIEERGEDPQMQDVPGGATGLLVHQVKGIGQGANLREVDEYKLDAALLAELRAHEKQAAQELQQWTERATVRTEGETTVKVLRGVSMDDL